ncbi:hypothetical protein SPZE110945_01150 [Sphingomonas zeae]
MILLRKRKKGSSAGFHLIAADEETITDLNGTRAIETFEELPKIPTLTLTRRESDLIALANPGSRPPAVLEELHPWLPKRSYVPDSNVGYGAIKDMHARYGTHIVSAAEYCGDRWRTICNTLRRKTTLDARFYAAWHLPIQDVFVLEETRSDRRVVAIDVNAMYSACMQAEFPDPSKLHKIVLDREYEHGERLAVGLYRCRLSEPTTAFINAHNPFRTFFCGKRLGVTASEPIEVDLNEFEIDYYRRHFKGIHLVDAVVSDKVIAHPLAREAKRCFARRRAYEAGGNKPLAHREKFLATLLSSCAARPRRKVKTFADRQGALSFLRQTHGVEPLPDEPDAATDAWLARGRGITMKREGRQTMVEAPITDDGETCFMLGQRIVAKGRVRLLNLMERVLEFGDDVHVCYVNIDSVHFSVPAARLDPILTELHHEASDLMGSFKIEAVTSHGLWLEPGRYWLYSETIEKFRNRSIGDRARPFKDRRHHVTSRCIDDLHIPVRTSIRLERSMSDLRSLDVQDDLEGSIILQRLTRRDSSHSFVSTLLQLEQNRHAAIPHRLRAFADLKFRLDSIGPAASGPS